MGATPTRAEAPGTWSSSVVLDEYRGALALELQLSSEQPAACQVGVEAQGLQQEEVLPFYIYLDEDHKGPINIQNPEAHAGPLQLSASETLMQPSWRFTATNIGIQITGRHSLYVVANILSPGAHPDTTESTALSLELSCDHLIEPTMWASTDDVHTFTTSTFDGGIGGEMGSIPGVYTKSHVNLMDRWSAQTTADRTYAAVREVPAVDEDTFAEGTLRLTTPASTYVREINRTAVDIRVADGPGTYTVDLTRVALGEQPLYGMVIGLEPVPGGLQALPSWLDEQAPSG